MSCDGPVVDGVILTGGASRRMGVDKAFVEYEGRAMIDAVAAALRGGGCETIRCVGGDLTRLRARGYRAVPDPAPGIGPSAAIAACLVDPAEVTVIAACDLPRLTPGAVARLVDAASSGGVAVARAGGRHHLVLAVHASTVGDWQRFVASGIGPLREVLDRLAVEGKVTGIEVEAAVVTNVNHPDQVVRPSPAVSGGLGNLSGMDIQEVSVDELAALMADGVRVIDVREPDEYAAGRVPGAELIPLATVPDEADRFRSDGTTYVVCRSGGRSLKACEFLAAQGIDVANVAGGTLAWAEAGHGLEHGDA